MFKIAIRSLEDETYHDLPQAYKTREEAIDAVKHMYIQVRPSGDYIQPEEFQIRPLKTKA